MNRQMIQAQTQAHIAHFHQRTLQHIWIHFSFPSQDYSYGRAVSSSNQNLYCNEDHKLSIFSLFISYSRKFVMCFRLHFDHTHGLELWSSVLDITNVVEFVLVNSLHFSSSSWGMFILKQSLIIEVSRCNLKGNIVAQSTHTCPSSCATVKAALSPLS